MVVGELPESVDLLVVGGGPGGYAAALHAARSGRAVLLVDRDGAAGVGGVCLRVGCVPSKALIEHAHVVSRYAELTGGPAVSASADLSGFQRRRADLVDELTAGVRRLLAQAGVRVLGGRLRFNRADQAVVEAGDGPPVFLEFRDVVLATGSRPMALPDLPYDGAEVIDSTGALALDAVPRSMAVVGGGYIGVELGTAFAKLGARVTLVESCPTLLPAFGAELSGPVTHRLGQLGVEVQTGTRVEGRSGSDLAVVVDGVHRVVPAATVVVALGRRPNTDDLGLDRLGVISRADGRIEVGPDRLARPHVAAVGDITPGPALAHTAYAEAEVAVEALCGRRTAYQPGAVPAVVFGDPEVATVGLTRTEATGQGRDVVSARVPMGVSARARILGRGGGFLELVADATGGALVGLHAVGPGAGELVAEATLAIEMGATIEDLAQTIHVHPTLSELVGEAARVALGRPVNAAPSPTRPAAPR